MSRPLILGLTGSVGMGKSTVAGMFEDLGVPVFDADAVVHRLQGRGGALLEAIEAAFPGSTGPEGVDRRKLGAVVFDDPDALARLEAIVHPAVRAARREFLLEHAGTKLVVRMLPRPWPSSHQRELKSQPEAAPARSSRKTSACGRDCWARAVVMSSWYSSSRGRSSASQ